LLISIRHWESEKVAAQLRDEYLQHFSKIQIQIDERYHTECVGIILLAMTAFVCMAGWKPNVQLAFNLPGEVG
jgi:hypothetical protein